MTTQTDIAIFAKEEAEEIRRLLGKTAAHLVEIGRRLIEIKRRMNHGEWGDYLRREFDWTERSAQRFMGVAEQFKNDNLSEMSIAPSALYLIAASSTPEPARRSILDRARSGERITYTLAKETIAASKPRTLLIDPVFSTLWPPMPPAQFASFERSIVERGVHMPLIVWNGYTSDGKTGLVLLDGHLRYEICHKHGIPFKVQEVELSDRVEALELIESLHIRASYTPDELAMFRVNLENYLAAHPEYAADEYL